MSEQLSFDFGSEFEPKEVEVEEGVEDERE